MPIIYTYPTATPAGDDLLIFSDVSNLDPNKATRKCTINDIVSLVGGLVPGGGTVTSVGLDFGTTGLLTSGGTSQTITGAGTFTVTGTLNVDNGGTERSTLTQHAILVGDGTSPVQMIGPLTNGQLLIGSTGAAPVAASLTAGSGVSITPGAGSITIAATGTTYTAGDGLDLTGTTFSTDLRSNGGLVINATELQVDLGATDMANHLAVSDGGTGQTTYTNGQILIGNTTGNTLNKATLTAGSNISIVNGAGSISIASTAGAPSKVDPYTGLRLKGSTSGVTTYNPATNLAAYWTSGDFVYVEFYMSWTGATSLTGDVILSGLPIVAYQTGTVDNGNCTIHSNNLMGSGAGNAPLTGWVGLNGATQEMNFRTIGTHHIMKNSSWTYIDTEGAGSFTLGGTITYLAVAG